MSSHFIPVAVSMNAYPSFGNRTVQAGEFYDRYNRTAS